MILDRGDAIHGYRVPILQGVWSRIIVAGVPRFYARCWACFWLFLGLMLLTYWGVKWLLVPCGGWLVGHGALVLLTQWNPKWDEIALAQMNQRYKSRYHGGR
jgi:hypothetical protein